MVYDTSSKDEIVKSDFSRQGRTGGINMWSERNSCLFCPSASNTSIIHVGDSQKLGFLSYFAPAHGMMVFGIERFLWNVSILKKQKMITFGPFTPYPVLFIATFLLLLLFYLNEDCLGRVLSSPIFNFRAMCLKISTTTTLIAISR